MKELNQFFRKVSHQCMFSARSIFGTQKELWISKTKYRVFVYSTKQKDSEELWYNGITARLPASFGIKSTGIMITQLSDSVWDLRVANTEEYNIERKSYKHEVHANGYVYVGKELSEHLCIGDARYTQFYVVVNDKDLGSYVTVQAMKDSDVKKFLLNTPRKCGNKTMMFARKEKRDGLYLPKSFFDSSEKNEDCSLPVWLRNDGAVIIEGRPGICDKCGETFSRYRYPLIGSCPKCSKNERVRSLCEEIMNL